MQTLARLLLIAGFVSILANCEKNPDSGKDSEYLRLRCEGGHGIDGDIRVYPDDTFIVRFGDLSSGEFHYERAANSSGIFTRITDFADSLNAWRISTDSLKQELKSVGLNGRAYVNDGNHIFLEFRTKRGTMIADCYAADSIAEDYPTATHLKNFAAIETAIRNETAGR